MTADIVYVDQDDNLIGSGTITNAYKTGTRVRIARVFLTNSKGELLIQKRSDNHRSLPGRWDQSAAGHVDVNETYLQAASRELAEEMGIKGVNLKEVVKFYTEETEGKTVMKRFNMIYSGFYDGAVNIDNIEVSDYRWVSPDKLQNEMNEDANNFTEGFIKSFEVYRASI